MLWFLFIFALTCTLSWIGLNTLWSFFFASVIWFASSTGANFSTWLFWEILMTLFCSFAYVMDLNSCCSTYTFKKPEQTPEQKREHDKNIFISLSMLWGIILIWWLCTLLF